MNFWGCTLLVWVTDQGKVERKRKVQMAGVWERDRDKWLPRRVLGSTGPVLHSTHFSTMEGTVVV